MKTKKEKGQIKTAWKFYMRIKADKKLRSEIAKKIQENSFSKFLENIEIAKKELDGSSRLKNVFFAKYSYGSTLGRGCEVLRIGRNKTISIEWRAGKYGRIFSY